MLRKEQNDLLTQTGPGTPSGKLFRSYWLPALLAEELPDNDCPPVRVKLLSERLLAFRDSARPARPDRRVLRPSRRLAVVRPQRGSRLALPLSRLEIRRHRPVHRGSVRAGGERLLPAGQAQILSAGRARRRAVDLYGRARKAAAAAGVGVRHRSRRAPLRRQAHPGIELAAGDGGRHRFEPRVVPAPRRSQHRSAVQGRQGQPVQHGGLAAGVRGGRERRRPLHRRPPQCRERPLLLAHHPVGDAVLHHDRAARQPFGPRPFLDPDRRRELLDLELRLSPDPRTHRRRGRGDAATARASTSNSCPAPSARSPTRTTTT